jgi:predicted DNA-binding transcriptional regulator AlpA
MNNVVLTGPSNLEVDAETGDLDRLLLPDEVCARVRLSAKTIYRLRRKKMFPAPIILGERRLAWRSSDIEHWLGTRSKAALTYPVEAA